MLTPNSPWKRVDEDTEMGCLRFDHSVNINEPSSMIQPLSQVCIIYIYKCMYIHINICRLPQGLSSKETACNAGDVD